MQLALGVGAPGAQPGEGHTIRLGALLLGIEIGDPHQFHKMEAGFQVVVVELEGRISRCRIAGKVEPITDLLVYRGGYLLSFPAKSIRAGQGGIRVKLSIP